MANKNPRQSVGALLDPSVFGAPASIEQVVTGSIPAAGGASGGSSSNPSLDQLTQELQQLQTASQTQTETVQTNTEAVNQNTTQLGQGGQSTASRTASTLESGLGLGMGLSPLITGLIGLFGGGSSESAPVMMPFAMPPAASVNAGVGEGAAARPLGADSVAGGPAAASPANATITVQIQALDSQSFLDHSNDIALAVRQAMLESTVLNDVIREV